MAVGAIGSGIATAPALARIDATALPGPDDGYFFSASNPVANRDQQVLEATACRLFARPDIQAAVGRAGKSFAVVTDQVESAEVMAQLPAYARSFAFRSIQLAVNSDPDYPRVMRVYTPAAHWLGNDVPESRWGQENPDNIYRIIPVAHGSRYVIRGRKLDNPSRNVSYVLVGDTNTSVTLGLVEQDTMMVAADGSFEITLDDTPAAGRSNHLQLHPDALYVFVRDTMSDWRQAPNALRVERLDTPGRAPLSDDELAARAMKVMNNGVAAAFYWNRLVRNAPMGHLATPLLTGGNGGLLTQLSSHGWFDLADGQAAIVTVHPLDSAYQSIVLYDFWGRSLEYRDRQTCYNNAMMEPDADGRFSFVIARRDPGVYNWLDPMGLHEFAVGYRWQGLPKSIAKPPRLRVKLVAEAELAAALPSGIRKVSPFERAAQRARRQQEYDRRYIES